MMNFLMLLAFAAMLTEVRQPPFQERRISLISVGLLSFALLAVTLLNPSFNASFTMTNQGDTSTMVTVGALGLMFWNLIDALVRKDRAAKQELFLQILLVSTLLILIKQGNLALLGLLIIAFLVVSWKNKVLKEASVLVLIVFIAAFLFRYIWQHHVDTELAGNGKGLNPVHEWRWDLLAPLLKAMGSRSVKKERLLWPNTCRQHIWHCQRVSRSRPGSKLRYTRGRRGSWLHHLSHDLLSWGGI